MAFWAADISAEPKGKGMDWHSWSDNEECICRREVGLYDCAVDEAESLAFEGTVPEGRIESIYGLTKAIRNMDQRGMTAGN